MNTFNKIIEIQKLIQKGDNGACQRGILKGSYANLMNTSLPNFST